LAVPATPFLLPDLYPTRGTIRHFSAFNYITVHTRHEEDTVIRKGFTIENPFSHAHVTVLEAEASLPIFAQDVLAGALGTLGKALGFNAVRHKYLE
jgi:hypothetical protein